MLDVKLTISRTKVDARTIQTELVQAAFREVESGVKQQLSSIRCPKHGESPKVTVQGRSFSKLQWKVHGCCEEVRV